MGVYLTPIIVKEIVKLKQLRGRRLAVDGNGMLYEFLSRIRLRDGTPLKDRYGRVTSHLAGLVHRVARLLDDYEIDLVLVFDGKPPGLRVRPSRRGGSRGGTQSASTRRRWRGVIQPQPSPRPQ